LWRKVLIVFQSRKLWAVTSSRSLVLRN
jgi:hypothetical protein